MDFPRKGKPTMKKLLLTAVALAALTLMAAPHSSYAQDDYIGLYFDDNASCTTGAFLDHVAAYIVYLNPTLTSTRGFECGFDITSPTKDANFNTSVSVSYPAQFTDVGVNDAAAGSYNYITGYATPVEITGSSFVFGTLDIFILDPGELDFTLRGAIPSSDTVNGLPMVMLDDFSLMTMNLAQAEGSATIILNPTGDCGVSLPTEDMSFGAVKGLFR